MGQLLGASDRPGFVGQAGSHKLWPLCVCVCIKNTHQRPAFTPPQEELGYLKAMWDMVAAVLHTFQAWSGMRWGSINVESLQEVRASCCEAPASMISTWPAGAPSLVLVAAARI